MYATHIIFALVLIAIYFTAAAVGVAHLYMVAHRANRYAKAKAMRQAHMGLGQLVGIPALVIGVAVLGAILGGAV